MTVTVSAIYRQQAGAPFDFGHYADHLRLVRDRWGDGLAGVEAYRGASDAAGGSAPVVAITLLHFESPEAMKAALGGPHLAEIQADIANFTSIQPELQINASL